MSWLPTSVETADDPVNGNWIYAYGTLLVGNYNQSPFTSYSVDECERRVAKWQVSKPLITTA